MPNGCCQGKAIVRWGLVAGSRSVVVRTGWVLGRVGAAVSRALRPALRAGSSARSDLIVIDDIGSLPAGQDAAEAFYRVVDAAYERRSVAVTSNIKPSGFDTVMPKTLATTTVDRLLHHAHQIMEPDPVSRTPVPRR